MARDIAKKDTRVIRAAKEALNFMTANRSTPATGWSRDSPSNSTSPGCPMNCTATTSRHEESRQVSPRRAGAKRPGKWDEDKRTTLDEAVAHIERHDHRYRRLGLPPQSRWRSSAHCCTDVTDLTVVTYGGPDIGLLCSAGKVKKVYYGFVSLDSPPFYDPWFSKARTTGAIVAREMDEGHAPQRFAGCGTTSSVPADAGRAGQFGAGFLGR